jgi:osmotically-inducible protein OsmY
MSQDRELQKAILPKLASQVGVTAAHIGVTAKAGVVTLSGPVDQYQKDFAEGPTAGPTDADAGAKAFKVRRRNAMKGNNEDIARAAIHQLAWPAAVPHDSAELVGQDRVVILNGEVKWPYQHAVAEKTHRELIGVVGIPDRAKLRPCANPTHISIEIDAALHRSRDERSTISIMAEGGRVILSGTVRTPEERKLAGETASQSPGALLVQNDLVVV